MEYSGGTEIFTLPKISWSTVVNLDNLFVGAHYRISVHLAACWYKQVLPETCLSDSGNNTGLLV